jgi:hypothetical protein
MLLVKIGSSTVAEETNVAKRSRSTLEKTAGWPRVKRRPSPTAFRRILPDGPVSVSWITGPIRMSARLTPSRAIGCPVSSLMCQRMVGDCIWEPAVETGSPAQSMSERR